MAGGWIKLHRKLLDSQAFSDPDLFRLWCYMLLRANFKPSFFRGEAIGVGQIAFTQRLLCESLAVSKGKIHRDLSRLVKIGSIAIKAGREFSVATICNWELYQDVVGEAGAQAGREPGADGPGLGQTPGADGPLHKKERIPQGKNLSMVDGDQMCEFSDEEIAEVHRKSSEILTKLKMRCASPADRDTLSKFVVLGERGIGQAWLADGVEGTRLAVEKRKIKDTAWGYLFETLRDEAKKRGFNLNQELARLILPEELKRPPIVDAPPSPRLVGSRIADPIEFRELQEAVA